MAGRQHSLGVASFLVLEAIGATLLLQYGFVNAFWAVSWRPGC